MATHSASASATLGHTLAGAATLEPSVVVEGVLEHLDDGFTENPRTYYSGRLDSLRLAQLTYAPLVDFRQSAEVRIRSKDGYQAEPSLQATAEFADCYEALPPRDVPPVILSGRGRWIWQEGTDGLGSLHLYDAAAIVDGRVRIGAFAQLGRRGISRPADFVILPSLTLEEERELHEATRQGRAQSPGGEIAAPRSAAPRRGPDTLQVTTIPRRLKIASEYFYAIREGSEYVRMIEVHDVQAGTISALPVEAPSLFHGLEDLRLRVGALLGLRVRIRRESDEHQARYLVELDE